MALVGRMGLGWNLGNTMEACGVKGTTVTDFETGWGNPVTNRQIFAKVRQSGFSSVRIPVAWSNLIGSDFTINPALMARVQQIVDMAMAEGLIVVLNIHWDGGWWKDFPSKPDASMARYQKLWTQISARFKDYPETLVFESLNEEGCFNDVWDRYKDKSAANKARAFGILNKINQSFVNLVRASGGKNATRHLLIAGYATDIDLTTAPEFKMPQDPMNRCIVSIHYYTPYPFAGMTKDESWGKMRSTWGTPADIAELDKELALLKARFLDNGVPVIMGEYGSEKTNKQPASVRKYLLTVAEKSRALGICPMLWDPGSHLDRRNLRFFDSELGEAYKKLAGGGK
jgi:endoglucanase